MGYSHLLSTSKSQNFLEFIWSILKEKKAERTVNPKRKISKTAVKNQYSMHKKSNLLIVIKLYKLQKVNCHSWKNISGEVQHLFINNN